MQHILGALSLDAYLITGNERACILWKVNFYIVMIYLRIRGAGAVSAMGYPSQHAYLQYDGWFTGKEIPALLQAFVYSVFVIR